MKPGLPTGAAVVVLGSGGAALGRRVCEVLPGARLYGPRAQPGDWDEAYDRVVPAARRSCSPPAGRSSGCARAAS